MNRREFLLAVSATATAAASEPRTFAYKEVDGHKILADGYGLGGTAKPVVVWIHGGALIIGSRGISPKHRSIKPMLDAGFAVISIDYRLAPETKLPGLMSDVKDAFLWIEAKAGELGVDPTRLVVCGGSAGGYLTLMTGFAVKPKPRALVSYYGYGDIVGDWYAKPDPFYLKQPAVTREEAVASLGNKRGKFYLYCRQQGLWPKEVSGHDPVKERRWFKPYCPELNVTRHYPPTMLVHGTADTDVPYELSRRMAARLEKKRVEHQFVTVPNGAHGLGNIPVPDQERIYADAAAFLKRHVAG